jgi:hypothetical protein
MRIVKGYFTKTQMIKICNHFEEIRIKHPNYVKNHLARQQELNKYRDSLENDNSTIGFEKVMVVLDFEGKSIYNQLVIEDPNILQQFKYEKITRS